MTNKHQGSIPIWKRPELAAYIVLLCVCLLLTAFIGLTERPSYMSSRKKDGTSFLTHYTSERVEDPTAPQGYYDLYTVKLDKSFRGEIYLAYRLVHEFTEVYVSGEIIYAINRPSKNLFGKSVGNCWAVVPLYAADFDRKIEVRIYPVYKGADYVPFSFIVGERSEIVSEETLLALPSIISSLIALILGLVFVIASRAGTMNHHSTGVELRCLGFFAILLAFWRLSDMRVSALLLPDQAVMLSFVTLLSLMLMPVPMIIYLWSRLKLSKRSMFAMCTCFLALDAAILIMQLTGIRDIRENLLLIHASDVAALILTLIGVVWSLQKDHFRINISFNPFLVLVVGAGIAADLVQYYFHNVDPVTVFTIFAVDIYLAAAGLYYLTKMRRDASIDAATGLYNKNRCQERIAETGPAPEGTMFIMCDLNGLKHVNDTMGHEDGDRMIASFSKALKKTFSRSTDFVGRYGGDEFIVVLDNVMTKEEASEQIRRLARNVEAEIQQNPDLPLSYSCGCSLAMECPGENAEYLLRRADMEMYLAKKAWHDAHPEAERTR